MNSTSRSTDPPTGPLSKVVVFDDRLQAGDALGRVLSGLDLKDPLVLGMARGGVPVAARVASRLAGTVGQADLDVVVSCKIGAPGQPELAVGAVGENEVVIIERAAVDGLGIGSRQLDAMVSQAQTELARRVSLYRGDMEMREVSGREVIVVDDGVATGHTARAALDSVLMSNPARLILAVPVCPRAAVAMFNDIELVCLSHPHPFVAVGQWYRNFDQVGDDQVMDLLSGPPRR